MMRAFMAAFIGNFGATIVSHEWNPKLLASLIICYPVRYL